MSNTITTFDTKSHHLYIEGFVVRPTGRRYSLNAILDTGAPHSEFSDSFLISTGFLPQKDRSVILKDGLQTQKYGKIILPELEICGRHLLDWKAFVSYFGESWGVDALIGLDFFRKFRVSIDYSKGELVTENF